MWGIVTLDEMETYTDICVQMLIEAQAHNPHGFLHIIIDMRQAESIPPLYLMISQGVRVLKFRNRGTMFLIATHGSIRAVMELTARVTREHFPLRIFSERQEALDALTLYLARDKRR